MSRRILRGDASHHETHDLICAFVRLVLGEDIDFGQSISIGVVENEMLIGGIVFHDWQQERKTVEITGASTSPKWLTADVVKRIAKTCFDDLQAFQVVARCDAGNKTTTRIFKALGFEAITIPNMRGPHRPEILFYQTSEGWLNTRFCQ